MKADKYGDRPVLIYCKERDKLIPHLHKWIDRKGKVEKYIDIATLSSSNKFMIRFKYLYPYCYNLFMSDRNSVKEWLYTNYMKITIK